MGHIARKRFGQHFLADSAVIDAIVAAIAPQPGEAIVEIGPGLGAMTQPLLARCGRLTVIELDRDLAARLRRNPQLEVIEADVLTVDFAALAERAGGRLRVVGNLPYNISSPLLFSLTGIAERVVDQHFMLQKEVVERMVAPPGSRTYGRLSVMLQFRYVMARLFDVPRGAFNPTPQVTSSIVRMVPRPEEQLPAVDFAAFGRVVAAAFGQRRKTLRNALSALLDADAIKSAGVDPQARAEVLANEDFVRLARRFAESAPDSVTDATR